MITATLEQMKAFGMCDETLAAHEKYMQDNNLSEITFDQGLAMDKSLGRRDWMIWALERKPLMAKFLNYTIPDDEAAADAALLKDLQTGQPTGAFQFNNIQYNNLASAQAAVTAAKNEKMQQALTLTVINRVTITDEQHETWVAINVDTEIEPSEGNWCYKVFNHVTGQYLTVSTLAEAKTTRQSLAQKDVDNTEFTIFLISRHPDFLNDVILVPI